MARININIEAESAEEARDILKGLAAGETEEVVQTGNPIMELAQKAADEIKKATEGEKPAKKRTSRKKAEEPTAEEKKEPVAEGKKESVSEEQKEEPVVETSKEEPAPKELTEDMKVELRTKVAEYIHSIPDGKDRIKQFLKGKGIAKVTELSPADLPEFKALLGN